MGEFPFDPALADGSVRSGFNGGNRNANLAPGKQQAVFQNR
jgi:hypothetical protein